MRIILFVVLFFSGSSLWSQSPEKLADSLKTGFRGLSVVNDSVYWMSGRKGLIGNTTTGGEKWMWNRIKNHEQLDFRSLHAFDKNRAVVASAGTPAVILTTENGGKSWVRCYFNNDSAMFFDGLGFWDEKHGLIFGDPVNGRMFLMETFDAVTWKEIPFEDRPILHPGEASFAASGTTIRVLPGGHVYIATGGAVSRLWHSRDYGHHWEVFATPIIQGQPSQGIFSIAFRDSLNGIIVGGDYLKPDSTDRNVFVTNDGGKTWITPAVPTKGYRSCVEFIGPELAFAIGPGGMEFSPNDGLHWIATTGSGNTIKGGGNNRIIYAGGKTSYFSSFTLK
ncbi:MAG TPA: YCF48-related protein [Bacteroidia bacterium]|nr:YCF48-related protein [Bacteroidia bacterium]